MFSRFKCKPISDITDLLSRDLVAYAPHPFHRRRALTSERLEATKMSLFRICAKRTSSACSGRAKTQKRTGARVNSAPASFVLCGERGIRTPEASLNSFQDCRFKPLTHLSFCLECKDILKTFTQKSLFC